MYTFFLGDVRLPVAPSRIDVRYGNALSRLDLADGREVLLGNTKKLAGISFSALLPWMQYPFAVYTDGFRRGDEILADLLALKDGGRAFRFIMHRQIGGVVPAPINIRAVFEEIRIREDASDGSDIYVDIRLSEFQEIAPRKVLTNSGALGIVVEPQNVTRPIENKPEPRTYTVVRGDSLWAIAHRFLGNGNRWQEIYRLNKSVIDARNRGTGNPYYTIYPGQVFKLL
jgi:LysM repeat protein